MRRAVSRTIPILALVAGVAWLTVGASGQTGQGQTTAGKPSTSKGDWPHYTADLKGTKYSPLDQIDTGNFNKLEVAWRFKTDNLGTRPEFKLEGTPLAINGIIYATGGTRRDVFALNGNTGELRWLHAEFEGQRAAISPRQLSGRGLSYWTDAKGDERIVYVTTGYKLIELNARTGAPVATFGKNGVLDLKEGVQYGTGQQIDLETGEIGLHSTPTVVGDVVIVGSAFKEGMTVKTHNNSKGLVRAFDVKTGKQLWRFNTIPKPGEFGNDTWLNDSWSANGNTGVWSQITVDEELGLVYLPVESPTSDYYGGERPGNNLFGESLVCVDLKTGQRKWHFQLVHHPIWDFDISSAPILADITVNGKAVKAVLQPTKQAWLYVFDRITGQPVWPIEERPVPKGDVPGEWYAPTQPFPPASLQYARNYVKIPDDLIDFTPEMRTQALENIKHYKTSTGPFNPPIVGSLDGLRGGLNIGNASGGTNWPGAGYDPETHIFYSQASNSAVGGISVRKPPAGFSDIRYVSGIEGTEFRVAEGPGFGSAADAPQRPAAPATAAAAGGGGRGGAGNPTNLLNVDGLPIVKPPYGLLAAINLDTGELMWQVPHGDTPDLIRNHPKLRGLSIPKTGQGGSVGVLVTKTLVIVGDPQVTTTEHPRGAMLRAYDKKTGNQVGAVYIPAAQSGSPMTYSMNGKQYIIVAVSGGTYSGEYIAFSLPQGETRTTSQAQ